MVMKKAGYICIGFLAVCATAYATILTISPLPLLYIDTNKSGFVSLEEALNSIDIGKRKNKRHPDCTEYYWLKDGFTAYINCSDINK